MKLNKKIVNVRGRYYKLNELVVGDKNKIYNKSINKTATASNIARIKNSQEFLQFELNKKSQSIKSKILPVSHFLIKNAQMKIQQMAFMVIAVMVFFALVGLVILAVAFSGLKDKATELNEKNAMLLVSKLANSPEFSCGYAFSESKGSCIDADKVMILKNNADKYKKFWGASSIKIRKIYPKEQETKCNLGTTYPDCNLIEIISGEGTAIQNFVALCRKEYDGEKTYNKCELAKIFVSYKQTE